MHFPPSTSSLCGNPFGSSSHFESWSTGSGFLSTAEELSHAAGRGDTSLLLGTLTTGKQRHLEQEVPGEENPSYLPPIDTLAVPSCGIATRCWNTPSQDTGKRGEVSNTQDWQGLCKNVNSYSWWEERGKRNSHVYSSFRESALWDSIPIA